MICMINGCFGGLRLGQITFPPPLFVHLGVLVFSETVEASIFDYDTQKQKRFCMVDLRR